MVDNGGELPWILNSTNFADRQGAGILLPLVSKRRYGGFIGKWQPPPCRCPNRDFWDVPRVAALRKHEGVWLCDLRIKSAAASTPSRPKGRGIEYFQ